MEIKMKTYVLTLSKVFTAFHPRKGEPTNFRDAFNVGQSLNKDKVTFCGFPKIHTIRDNYELWAKRFEQIERGEAKLSIRQWSGKPYHSKQEIICNLTKADGIGIQKMFVCGSEIIYPKFVDDCYVETETIANNDGLSDIDWLNWFKRCDMKEPLAVIHFTKFRY